MLVVPSLKTHSLWCFSNIFTNKIKTFTKAIKNYDLINHMFCYWNHSYLLMSTKINILAIFVLLYTVFCKNISSRTSFSFFQINFDIFNYIDIILDLHLKMTFPVFCVSLISLSSNKLMILNAKIFHKIFLILWNLCFCMWCRDLYKSF